MSAEPRITALPYLPNSALWFAAIRHMSHAIWLDSGVPGSQGGRFDILGAAPVAYLETLGQLTHIRWSCGHQETSDADPFELVARYLPPNRHTPKPVALPFVGGALGYFGYDLGRRLETLPSLAHRDIDLPDMAIGIYPWAIIQDHDRQEAWLVCDETLAAGDPESAYNFLEIERICFSPALESMFHDLELSLRFSEKSFKINKFRSNINVKNYATAIARIRGYIQAGDCYQVNFAQRFEAPYEGDPFIAYLRLRESLPSPHSAFMQLPAGAVLSFSPERFIQVRGDRVETRPIKGTVARGASAEEDDANINWLQHSEKNRAENLMIVDLLRNDLSKHCVEVRVPQLFELQSLANVHHLVSTVTARLGEGATALNVLRDSFPGGSITGAPKIRAMEIIEELEPTRRSLYCGSLGYIGRDGQMDSSIAIRTLVCTGKKIICWGGGGIVADSDPAAEYAESLAKVKLLMTTLETHFSQAQHPVPSPEQP